MYFVVVKLSKYIRILLLFIYLVGFGFLLYEVEKGFINYWMFNKIIEFCDFIKYNIKNLSGLKVKFFIWVVKWGIVLK